MHLHLRVQKTCGHRTLDVLTAERGGTCAILGEECCYFVNASGIVMGKFLQSRIRALATKEILGLVDTPGSRVYKGAAHHRPDNGPTQQEVV